MSSLTRNEPNLFVKFVKQSESNLEHIVQIGKESGHHIERENLYKWLILTNILKMFSDNQSLSNNNDYQLLSQFLTKNSGYIDIRESEIKEQIQKQGFEINIEYLKRYFRSRHNHSLEIRQEKAPFYKLIPHLKEVLLKVLTSHEERENDNSYVIFFDDLDIGFNAGDKDSINAMITLLRVSKEINNEMFAKNSLSSKVVLLLRDDISKSLTTVSSDTAKIFSSYSIGINWYQDEYHNSNEEIALNIRKFINSRIKYSFGDRGLGFNSSDPWLSLVEEPFKQSNQYEAVTKSSFKYILDHTLFRPRDLLLFFNPLKLHKFNLPLSKQDTNHLIGQYCEELINELKNELSCFYSHEQIITIFNAIGVIASGCEKSSSNSVRPEEAVKIISEHCKEVEPLKLLEDLFERSMIGNMASNSFVFFKHREPATDKYNFKKDNDIILHRAIKIYCINKGYTT